MISPSCPRPPRARPMLRVGPAAAGTTLPPLDSCTLQPGARPHTPRARAARGWLAPRADWRRPEGGGRPAPGRRLEFIPGRHGQRPAADAARAGSPAGGLAGWPAAAVAILSPSDRVPRPRPGSWGTRSGARLKHGRAAGNRFRSHMAYGLPRLAQVCHSPLKGDRVRANRGWGRTTCKTLLVEAKQPPGKSQPGKTERVATSGC